MLKSCFKVLAIVMVFLTVIACNVKKVTTQGALLVSSLTSYERWSANDNPELLDLKSNFNYRFSELPLKGEAAKTPWAGSYWPNYQDSINARWNQNDLSPAEKYEVAFNKHGITYQVSRYHGIENSQGGQPCRFDYQCNKAAGEVCAMRNGAYSGYCVPTWYGLCHAWAPAAIMEEEPKKPVVYNGVEFKINDIKALATISYSEGLKTESLSIRCNLTDNFDEIEYDVFGRPTDDSCKDTNAGTFHVAIANLLGIQNKSFIEDRTFDSEVWNQPVRSYEVVEALDISEEIANSLVGPKGEKKASKSFPLRKEFHNIRPIKLKIGDTLELKISKVHTTDAYIVLDQDDPQNNHISCEGKRICTAKITKPMEAAVQVYSRDLKNLGKIRISIYGPSTGAYRFNDDAVSFKYIKTNFSYIAESKSSEDGNFQNVIDKYTETDSYEYILELDAEGKIIGGEWIGESKTNHPDFLWLPVEKEDVPVAGIEWHHIKKLLELSTREYGRYF